MEVEKGLSFADKLICDRTGQHLSTLQTEIFRGAWHDETYETIAQRCYCSEAHIKFVGKSLWDDLSQGLGEKISKKTFRAALVRRYQEEKEKAQLSSSLKVQNSQIPTQAITEIPIELELPEGQVKLGSPFYVERPPIETTCYQTVNKYGALIRIKAPRQMGKSSLMSRILDYACQNNCRTVVVDFQLADHKIFTDLDLLLKWFCLTIDKKLGLTNDLNQHWDDLFGSKVNCTDYLENHLLSRIDQPLALAIEEVDRLFAYSELADDFFSLLRAWHEEGKNNNSWQKLRLILVHSTEVYIPLNINQSPFNVGLAIELPEFTREQVFDLAQRHHLNLTLSDLDLLMEMVGGHPYLIRVALYHLAQQGISLNQLLSEAPTEAGFLGHHLRRHQGSLEQQPPLAKAMKQVIQSPHPIRLESMTMFKLHSMGLVSLQGNEITPRCQLYQQYFSSYQND